MNPARKHYLLLACCVIFFVEAELPGLVGISAEESTDKYVMIMESNKPASISAYNKGLQAEQTNNPLRAIEFYKQAIALYPPFKEANNNLGSIYYDLGMYEKAIGAFTKAFSADPTYYLAAMNLGMAYYAIHRYADAIVAFERGRQGLPSVRDPLYFLGRSYAHEGQYEKAAAVFEYVLTLDPEFYPAHYDLASTFMTLNKFHFALQHYKTVLLLAPHHEKRETISVIIKRIERLDLRKSEIRNSVRGDDS